LEGGKRAVIWRMVLGVLAGLVLAYLLLLAALLMALRRHGTDAATARQLLRLLPDVIRLVGRLAADRSLPRGVRLRLAMLLGYLVLPVDLVPDVIPVLGYADDAVITAIVLRSVVRRAGPEALRRHWPGTPEGLAAVARLAGLH